MRFDRARPALWRLDDGLVGLDVRGGVGSAWCART